MNVKTVGNQTYVSYSNEDLLITVEAYEYKSDENASIEFPENEPLGEVIIENFNDVFDAFVYANSLIEFGYESVYVKIHTPETDSIAKFYVEFHREDKQTKTYVNIRINNEQINELLSRKLERIRQILNE